MLKFIQSFLDFVKCKGIEKMEKELAMAEVLKVPLEREGEDEHELSLELSIGGNYVKRLEGKTKEENDSRSDISENDHGFVDLRKKKEIQALRRQEARMKREEKLKKSRVLHLVEDKQTLEAQKFQARVQDRESREKEGILDDSFLRKEKNGTNEAVQDSNISLFSQKKTQCLFQKELYFQTGNGFGYPSVVEEEKNGKNEENVSGSVAHWSRNGNGSWNSSMDCESLERSSPAASDYQSTSQKGGSSSDTGSHSSRTQVHQNQHASRNDKIEHQEVNNPSSKSEPEHCTNKVVSSSTPRLQSKTSTTTPKPEAETHPIQTNNICSNIKTGVVNKLPTSPNYNSASTQHMPRVSTTGNGPNGKTITGFLYKYSNNEVSILCSCHGSSFSPAQFVEHAGGVDISQPLRHITMVPPFLK